MVGRRVAKCGGHDGWREGPGGKTREPGKVREPWSESGTKGAKGRGAGALGEGEGEGRGGGS